MTMLGMQTDMQCHYFPSYFSTRDVNLNASSSVWPSSTSADNFLMNGNYYNGNLAPPFPDPYLAYKDKFKQIILQHEAIFKSQVHELHRLYYKQRELMTEMKRIEFHNQHLQLENPTPFEYKHKASIASAIPWLNPVHDHSSNPFAENNQSHTAYVQENIMLAAQSNFQTESINKELESLELNCKKVGKKILDLELPAYEYIDSDTESLAEEMNPMKSCVEKVKCFADLNEPVKLEDETYDEYNDFLHTVLDHEEIQRQDLNLQIELEAQVIENAKTTGDPQHECLCDNDDIDQGSENSPSYPLDVNNRISVSKRKYHSDSSSRKQMRDLKRFPIIVQALPCSKSSLLLRGTSKRRSYRYVRDNSASEDGSIEKHVKGIDLNAISPCYSPEMVAKSSKELDFDCNSMPDSEENFDMTDLESVSRPRKKSKFHVDLNLCIDEDESSALVSIEPESHPPESPENKEQSPHRGDSDKNEKLEEDHDLVTMAAEAIVSISSSQVQKGDSLYWFAKLASSVVDDPNSEFGMVLSSKNQNLINEIDYFEAMTLQLEENVAEEYHCQANSIQVEAPRPSLPKRGRTRRGRQRNDFQTEILPSLASLSRYEVNEDLQAIGGLIEAAQTSRKRTGRNGLTRGRKGGPSLSSKAETQKPTKTPLCSVEERRLLDWGKDNEAKKGSAWPRQSSSSYYRPV